MIELKFIQFLKNYWITGSPILKSATVQSKTEVYERKIEVLDTITFASLISSAIKVYPTTGKQFIIRAADEASEYGVITGVVHTEIIIPIEEVD